jgi:hypothetical protein
MSEEAEEQEGVPNVNITYHKSGLFRVIKADGAWGGMSPRGDIVMSLFNERIAIPTRQTFSVAEDGGLDLIEEARDSDFIAREVEVAVSMRPEAALIISGWLMNKVRQFERQQGIKIILSPTGQVEIVNVEEEKGPDENKKE